MNEKIRLLLICETPFDEVIVKRLIQTAFSIELPYLNEYFEHTFEWELSADGREKFWRKSHLKAIIQDVKTNDHSTFKKFRNIAIPLDESDLDLDCFQRAKELGLVVFRTHQGIENVEKIDAVVVLLDGDTRPEQRIAGWKMGLANYLNIPSPPIAFAFGMPIESIEAWMLAMLVPNEKQMGTLEEFKRQFGIQPITESHRLSHKENNPKSSKKLLESLEINEQDCVDLHMQNADCIQRLIANGEFNGGKSFIEELRTCSKAIFSKSA